jgi:hypothetical protein
MLFGNGCAGGLNKWSEQGDGEQVSLDITSASLHFGNSLKAE